MNKIVLASGVSVLTTLAAVGGVVGVNYGSINQTINNANIEIGYMMNNPPIMVGSVYVGGIAGRVGSNAASKGGTISDCYNTGGINVKQGELIPPIFSTIRAQSQYVGGIAGTVETNASNLQRCYSVGFINLTGDKYTIECLFLYYYILTATR